MYWINTTIPGKYDHDLMAIWAQVSATEGDTACWSDFDSFDAFMSANLV